jgi:hypothetical protein
MFHLTIFFNKNFHVVHHMLLENALFSFRHYIKMGGHIVASGRGICYGSWNHFQDLS